MRAQLKRVGSKRIEDRIEAWVTDRYGSNALLVPPTSGLSETLYVVPVVAIGVAVVGLGWYLWRRRADPEDVSR